MSGTMVAPVESGHVVGGRRVSAHGGATFESRNPAHHAEVVGVFARGGDEEPGPASHQDLRSDSGAGTGPQGLGTPAAPR